MCYDPQLLYGAVRHHQATLDVPGACRPPIRFRCPACAPLIADSKKPRSARSAGVSLPAAGEDPEQRKKAKIPAEIPFQTKPQIALDQIQTAQAEGVAPGVVLADAGYGADGGFRAGLSELDLAYVVGVQPTLSVWRPGESPLPPKPWSGTGRPPSRLGRTDRHKPISAKALAEELDAETWRTIAWREGTNTELSSRFAAVRLRPASRDDNRPEAHAEEWLLIEWPEGEAEPSKYWLSTLPVDATITQLVVRRGLGCFPFEALAGTSLAACRRWGNTSQAVSASLRQARQFRSSLPARQSAK